MGNMKFFKDFEDKYFSLGQKERDEAAIQFCESEETKRQIEELTLEKLIFLVLNYREEYRIRDFLINSMGKNFKEKPFIQCERSLKNLPDHLGEEQKANIEAARVCAREIIDHLNFENIYNLEQIEEIVSAQIEIT